MGRPSIKTEALTVMVNVRFTPKEAAILRRLATEAGALSVSSFARKALLDLDGEDRLASIDGETSVT